MAWDSKLNQPRLAKSEAPRIPAARGTPAAVSEASVWRRRAVGLAERLMRTDADFSVVSPVLTSGRSRGDAVGLVNRLLDLEDRLFRRVDRIASAYPAPSAAGFDVPRDRHPWKARDQPEAVITDPYDRRVDDCVLAEAARGARFLARHGLLGDAPDHAAARNFLLAHKAVMSDVPEVSIVIPVHGQLGHTLNCLDSLLSHASRHSREVIVVDDASPDDTASVLRRLPGVRLLRQTRNQGFIASCNAGAAAARGRFVVLLNNDTRVVSGWLDGLIDSFATFPQAGLVGSKLFHPDGSLQEAGGILWRDGSAWNYGRGDDPNRPQYSHARKVDFISGAAIALPRDLWLALGGLDMHYAPAYAEDADLAMRVRAAGREVWLQPQSRAIHYEGATGGTDVSSGVKRFQTVNAGKLYLRWHEALSAHRANGVSAYFERERAVRKRALVIDATTPTPGQDAGSVTTVAHLRMLQDLGYKVSFLPQDNGLFQPGATTDLQAMGVECFYAPYDIGVDAILARYGRLLDVVLVFRPTVLEQVIGSVRAHAPQAVLLFNNMDLHFLRMRREAELAGDAALWRASEAMERRETALMRRVDCAMTPSSHELPEILARAVGVPALVMPFIAKFHGTAVTFADRRDICFLGGFRHSPNVDAARWFAREIMPLLRRAEPGIRFIVAGSHPSPEVLALACDDVVVTGMVADLRDVFDAVRVFACCVRAGAGVKGKLADAMSYGVPAVSTTIGAEGMGLVDGTDLLIADSAENFAAACLRLYRDPQLWARFSAAGQERVRSLYSLEHGAAVLRQGIEAGMARHRGLASA